MSKSAERNIHSKMKRILTFSLTLLAAAILCVQFAACTEEAPLPGSDPAELKAAEWLNTPGVKLADLKGKKIVVVEFWATWCPPCRQSIPHLRKIYETYKDEVELVSLTNEPLNAVADFAKQQQMTWPMGMGSTSGQDYGVKGIPHAFIIDKEGKFVWHGHPMAGLDEQLRKMLPNKQGQ